MVTTSPGEPGDPCAFDDSFGGGTPAHEIELVEHRAGGAGLHVLQPVPRDRREDIPGASLAGFPSGSHLAARVHEPAVSHRGEQEGQGQVEAQNASTQIATRNRHGMSRPECYVLEGAAILAEGDLAFGASVQIVEHGPGHSATCQRPQILDADNPRGRDLAGRSRHHPSPLRLELRNAHRCTGKTEGFSTHNAGLHRRVSLCAAGARLDSALTDKCI